MRGHIHKRVRICKNGRKSVLWYVVVELPREADGKRRQKWHGGYETKKAAEAVRARLVHELTTGFYVEPSTMRFDEWLIDHWLPVVKTRVKPTTYNAYRSAINYHIAPTLGGVQLGKLTSQMIVRLYQQLLESGKVKSDEGLAPATVQGVHVIIRKSLADAVDAGLIPRNPAEKARAPRPSAHPSELRYWTPAELKHFLELIEGHRLRAAFHLLAMTGARRGEVAGLRWIDVDLEGTRITIRQALNSVNGEVYASSPKSSRGRTIDLDRRTVEVLRHHLEDQETRGERYVNRDGGKGYVFRARDGSRINPTSLTSTFRWLVDESDLPRIRLHDLRHTHASIAVKAGVPIGVVSERLGHASPEFTLHRYSHVMPGMQRDAADRIARAVHLDDLAA
ncbi:MAG: tyrosine-type recombinase/integrase [Actinomycetota bacterium]